MIIFVTGASAGFGKAITQRLGLAIVKEIVDGHHGFITVNSEAGHGTTFRVTFGA